MNELALHNHEEVENALAVALEKHHQGEPGKFEAIDFAGLLDKAKALYPTVVRIYQLVRPGVPINLAVIADLTVRILDAVLVDAK